MGIGSGLYMYDVVVKSSLSLSHFLMSFLLQARYPSCHSTVSVQALTGTLSTNTERWSHPFFIHHQTPEREDVACFILALPYRVGRFSQADFNH